jgi:hypothetical protein
MYTVNSRRTLARGLFGAMVVVTLILTEAFHDADRHVPLKKRVPEK